MEFYSPVNTIKLMLNRSAKLLTGHLAGGALGKWRGWKMLQCFSLKYVKNWDQGGGAAAPTPSPWIWT